MNLNESWGIKTNHNIYKILKSLPRKDSQRILFIIESFSQNPFSGDIQKMKGENNIWCRRVGNYRIFYEIKLNERIIYIFNVKRRDSKTY